MQLQSGFADRDPGVTWINRIQVALWTCVAWITLVPRGSFLYDEAFFYDQASRVIHEGYFPIHGPSISGTHDPTIFTPGGAMYLSFAPPFVLGSNPGLGTAWLILLSSLGILFLDRTLRKIGQPAALRLFAVSFLTWSVWHAYLVDRIWNVHLYWGFSLILLSITLRVIHAGRERLPMRWPIAFGLLSSVIVQTHIGGGLAVLICAGLLLLHARPQLTVRNVALVASAVLVPFIPYLVSEIPTGFANTKGLGGTRPPGGWWSSHKVVRSFKEALFVYPGHLRDISLNPVAGGWGWLRIGASLIAALVFVYGLLQRHLFRIVGIAAALLMPLFFLLTKRDYFDHYVASVIPYFLLVQALGTWALYRKSKWLAHAHLLSFICVATFLWVDEYRDANPGVRIADRIEQASRLKGKAPTHVTRAGATEAFILWAVARNDLGFEPTFYFEEKKKPCSIQIGDPSGPHDIKIFPVSYFRCD